MQDSTDLHAPDDPDGTGAARATMRTVSLGTAWRVLRYPFVLLSMALIPRLMGKDAYGQYAVFMSVFMILDMATDIGFMQVFGRFVPEFLARHDRASARRLFHGLTVYGLLLALAAVLAAWLWHGLRPLPYLPPGGLLLLAALLLVNRAEGTLFTFLFGLNQIARFSAKEVLRSALTLVFVLAGYALAGLEGAFAGLILNELAMLGVAAAWCRPWLTGPVAPLRPGWYRPYLAFGVRFYVPMLLFGLLQRSGNLVISELRGASGEVAFYDIANQYLLLTATFLGLILSTLVPSLTSLHLRDDQDRIQRWQHTAMAWCGAAIVLAFNALMWLGRFVLPLLGEEFLPAFDCAVVMSAALPPALITYVGMNYAILRKEPGVYTWGVAVGVAVLFAAAALLVPRHGALGAAWATVAGYGSWSLVLGFHYGAFFRRTLRGFAAALLAGLPLAALYAWRPGLTVSVLICGCTSLLYVGMLLAFRIVGWASVRQVWASLQGGRGKD